jgi:rod shape-determining protein MreB
VRARCTWWRSRSRPRSASTSRIVDIGGGTTEIAVLSLAEPVVATSLRVAGDRFDEAIQNHLRKAHGLLIGEQTAERIKHTIGSAWERDPELEMEVKGRDSVSGLPRMTTINSIEIREALSDPIGQICEAIRQVLEQAPPEIAADLVDSGATVVGGGALLHGIDRAIAEALGIQTRIGSEPLTAVARGCGVFIEHLDVYANVFTDDDEG